MQMSTYHGPVTVSAEKLVTVLEPEVNRCERELHELVPELLQNRSDEFLMHLSEAQEGLQFISTGPEDLEKHLSFVDAFDKHRRRLDQELDELEAHYDLCQVLVSGKYFIVYFSLMSCLLKQRLL